MEAAQGLKFTKPPRTILDVIEADSVSKDIVRQAFERGLVSGKQIASLQMKPPARKLFEAELRRSRAESRTIPQGPFKFDNLVSH